ncbi:Anaerobic nitric oxide reductase flavorubredoxin [bioreactor metagenome]|uniref:Anaerobic nitric oxide reductase flavorubredoxin n=1 Tax=bioreactor metagenome TaxID=1076179 RepID=A0A645GG14_9ZZZZ
MAGILEEIKGLGFKNKKAAAFGTYGWSGESVKIITEWLKDSKFDVVNDGLKLFWNPDDNGEEECLNFGKEIALKE